jgi:hypothetical protein
MFVMIKPSAQAFVCPVCGWTKKAPYTEKDIIEHMKSHPEKNTSPEKVLRAKTRKTKFPY